MSLETRAIRPMLTYFGVMRGRTSWGKVGREMVIALAALDVDLNIYERKGFLFDENLRLPASVEARISQTFREDIVFTFEHPGVYDYLKGRFKVGMLTYESTVAPPQWVKNADIFLDLLLLPSTFCRDVFVAGGFPREKTEVIPYGYSADVYAMEGPTLPYPDDADADFRFLTVACPHKRKNTDAVLEAYLLAFSRADDVSLTVKLSYLPGKKAKPFEQRNLDCRIRELASIPSSPRLAVIYDYLSEAQLASLYRGASCLVSATRGEGFGMVYLEAMACGVPLIVTGWGGHLDFANEHNAHLVKYRLRPAKEIQYDCDSQDALIAEPDIDDLASAMREAYDSRHERKSPVDRRSLERFTWPHLARQFLETVSDRS